jgi:hypothetical protein
VFGRIRPDRSREKLSEVIRIGAIEQTLPEAWFQA